MIKSSEGRSESIRERKKGVGAAIWEGLLFVAKICEKREGSEKEVCDNKEKNTRKSRDHTEKRGGGRGEGE